MSTERAVPEEIGEPLPSVRWLTVTGVLLAVMGIVAIAAPFLTGVAISLLVGASLIVGSVAYGGQALARRDWRGFAFNVALCALYLVAGIALLTQPVLGLLALTVLLIAYLIGSGIVEVAMGLRLRPTTNWSWLVASGLLGIALGGLLWIGWPGTAAWALGLVVGVNLLASGLSFVGLATASREMAHRIADPPAS
jgi:uncharacterized membrane protein HdeD (DUF308 family)